MFGPRFNDDRGKSVRLHPLGEWVAQRAPLERGHMVLRGIWSFVRSPLGLMCLTAIVGATVIASLVINSGPWVLFLFVLSPIGGTSVLILLLIGIGTQRLSAARASKLRDVMLARGLCPVCAYELDAVTPEEDGCKVCPECGAAWIASEVSAPMAIAGHEQKVVVSEPVSKSPGR